MGRQSSLRGFKCGVSVRQRPCTLATMDVTHVLPNGSDLRQSCTLAVMCMMQASRPCTFQRCLQDASLHLPVHLLAPSTYFQFPVCLLAPSSDACNTAMDECKWAKQEKGKQWNKFGSAAQTLCVLWTSQQG
eukprot:scaffold51380_cov20-Tisochrysis_lutea.AAC.3